MIQSRAHRGGRPSDLHPWPQLGQLLPEELRGGNDHSDLGRLRSTEGCGKGKEFYPKNKIREGFGVKYYCDFDPQDFRVKKEV